MKIAVLSPSSRCGTTVNTLLMGYMMAATQNATVCLCYSGNNRSIKNYVGREAQLKDATRSISQVSKLLEAKSMNANDLPDYCEHLDKNIMRMDTWDTSLTEEDSVHLLSYAFSRHPADYVFCDIAYNIEDPVSQAIIADCDAMIVVCEPSMSSLHYVAEMRNNTAWPKDKPVMLLVGKYDEAIDSVEHMARDAGFQAGQTCKVHFNPFIQKLCNHGMLHTIIPYILDYDPRVLELSKDIYECLEFILSLQNKKVKRK